MKTEKEMWAVVTPDGEIIENTVSDSSESSIWIYDLIRYKSEPLFNIKQQSGYTCQKVKVTIEVQDE